MTGLCRRSVACYCGNRGKLANCVSYRAGIADCMEAQCSLYAANQPLVTTRSTRLALEPFGLPILRIESVTGEFGWGLKRLRRGERR